jgi:anti-sigma regulatory factor (Ser/Thr protein kinase)
VEVIRTFRGDAAEVPLTRHFVADVLERAGLEATYEVMLVTSELVTNAVVHGRDPLELHLEVDDGHLHLEVVDCGDEPPDPGRIMPASAARGGRGLPLVDCLTERWGACRDPRGRTMVWADLPAPAALR